MPRESMTPDERLWTAIRLGKPDRVPIVPMLLAEPAAGLTGRSFAEVARSNQAIIDAFFEVFEQYGGWDNPYPGAATPLQAQIGGTYPMKIRVPGQHLAEDRSFQVAEEEILQREDYDRIFEMGMEEFYSRDYLWRVTEIEPEELPRVQETLGTAFGSFLGECARRDLKPFFLGYAMHPFFTLSLMRSMVRFTEDLYFDPEPVERALQRMTDDLIEKQIPLIKATGIDLWLFVEERACGFFYPPAVFERFWWPYAERIVDACWSEGIVTLFHLDQCWDENIPAFRRLPRGSAILELDGSTNIFAAKEALRGHLCLHGDVPASLLSIGSPGDVAAYCRKLIDEVGGDGGFILGSGCSVPPDVRPENFRALIETGKGHAPGG